MASAIRSACRRFCFAGPTSEPYSAPMSSSSVGRPVSLPSALQKPICRSRAAEKQDAARLDVRWTGSQGTAAEVLERWQAAEVSKDSSPRCSVSRLFLAASGPSAPRCSRPERVVPRQRQGEAPSAS